MNVELSRYGYIGEIFYVWQTVDSDIAQRSTEHVVLGLLEKGDRLKVGAVQVTFKLYLQFYLR